MAYKKCYASRIKGNKYKIHLWDEGGYDELYWDNPAYTLSTDNKATHKGLNGEPLIKTYKWHRDDDNLHFHDMKAYQKFLVEKYGTNDKVSKNHNILFFDIECEIGGALTEEYISNAPMTITSIAYYYNKVGRYVCLILDKEEKLSEYSEGQYTIIPFKSEKELLVYFLEQWATMETDIVIGYNSDYFDIPYLYYRMCIILGKELADYMSPIKRVRTKKHDEYFFRREMYVDLVGVESLDWMRMHRKYSWKDEPSWSLDYLGRTYVNLGKIEYEGTLDILFKTDINKFIKYNFRDVEILIKLEDKFSYIPLTMNISHKGKHNYSEVYQSSVTQDGAISSYLLSQGIIPPPRDKNPVKKTYPGGYTFCPKAGLYAYMFDEDLTSLYPSIIMSLNVGKETYIGRVRKGSDANNRLGLSDLKAMEEDTILFENPQMKRIEIEISKVIDIVERNNYAISANGSIFDTSRKSTLSAVLEKWFNERVEYKKLKSQAYKDGDEEAERHWHLMQYTMKILLNSTYGATALASWRYGMSYAILSECITLTGNRIIQESAYCANNHMNEIMNNKTELVL